MRVIDLSALIADGMAVYPGDPEVKVKVAHTYESHTWELRKLAMGSHTGTHVDAPSHMHAGAATLDELPAERFFGPSRIVRIGESAWPEGRGLFFIESAGLECYERLAALRPSFVGGELTEELERALLGINILTYTGLQGLDRLPTNRDFIFYGFPLRIAGGDGSPVRAVAVIETEEEEE
ncbi:MULTISPECIES: cyclase family protein [unclassified Paenibacillus]|uniref:cyclase family protein n=1 Tax=unclassified Paenibacillus TaxID=185978 RepID=UPI001045CBCC|nr:MULTISPECIES: cyclase family protein [unclassified Paenibacillus]NIK68277.1 kynurenine formamidase [Paenibacillus sp. BK720]TCM99508.1 kynurenine formamidase [Paenibacillus sp. BK033]